MQQVLAYESDLLDTPTCSKGPLVVEALTQSIVDGAGAELDRILETGGVVAAVESGYLKSALVSSLSQRRHRMESGADVVVGSTGSPRPAVPADRLRRGPVEV